MTNPLETTLTFTLADLAISPLNVRFNERDANAVEALSASIVEQGLLEQLLIHPAPEGANWAQRSADYVAEFGPVGAAGFGVLAGGRRYRAIRLAISRGLLPPDWPIRCEIKDLSDQQIVLLSLSENLLRRDLQGYEVHAAIARLRGLGMTIGAIARNLGQTTDWVAQQARLGELWPPIFAAYCSAAIDVEQARAFASTEDHALQAAAWAHFAHWDSDPAKIRAFYKVGEHAYRAAGGHFELDLFASDQEHRGRVADEALLQSLAETVLENHRAAIRSATQRRDLRFTAQPPQRHGFNDTALEVYCETPSELAQDLPDEGIVATLDLTAVGVPVVRFWWASAKAKADWAKGSGTKATPPGAPATNHLTPHEGEALVAPTSYGAETRRIARDEHSLTASGLDVCRSIRRDILRFGLIRNFAGGGTVGLDLLIFALCRAELGREMAATLGMRGIVSSFHAADIEDPDLVGTYCQNPGREAFAAEVEALMAAEWLSCDDVGAGFALFLKLSNGQRWRAANTLAGRILLRSANAPGLKVPLHDALALALGLDAEQSRRAWTPDHHFAGLLSKMKRLELARPFVPADAFKSWKNLPDVPLAAATAHVLAAQPDWVHPVVSFDFDSFYLPEDFTPADKPIPELAPASSSAAAGRQKLASSSAAVGELA